MRSMLVCTFAILVMCGCALVSAQLDASPFAESESSLNIIKRSFVVSPESFVYDELHDKYIYTSRPDTRPLHEDGDRGKNNGQVSAFDPELSEISSADVVSQNFGFCEEARGTEIVGDRLFVAAMGQVCVFNTTTYEQLDSIGCCGASSAFDTHFLQGITWDPVRKMLWVTDLGAREQEVHNTGDDSDRDSGVTFDLNGKELIAAIDFKSLNDDGTYEIRKTLGFSSTDSDSDSFSRTGEDPLDRTVRFHPNGIVVDPKTGIIYVANTIVKTQEDDEGENEYASIWTCLPLGEAPCGGDCEGGFSETFDRTVSCNEIQSTRVVYKAGFNADGVEIDAAGNIYFTAWPSNVQSHQQGDDSDGFKDADHLKKSGRLYKLAGSAKKSVQLFVEGEAAGLEATLQSGPGCNSTQCGKVEARVLVQRLPEGAIQFTYQVMNGESSMESGIHVHAGTSCNLPLGLFSNKNPNAWFFTTYKTNALGNSEGSFPLDTGFPLEENEGHAVTIHDSKGVALACGILKMGPDQSTLIQPGDLTLDTKRNKLVIPSMDLFNTDSNVYYTVDLATANWEGFPVQTLETVTSNPEFATIKEFSSSWLSTPNAITYDAKNDRYLTTTGTSNRIERKIKIREPDSPYEEAGQISAWNAETSVLVSDLFGGCPQSWDSVVVDDLMYTASFMGWVCVMNLTDFNNGPNIGEKLLTGHNINGIAYDKKRELLWVTEVGTQGGNTRITHTQPSAPKDTFTAMIVAIDIKTRKVVAQTNVSNHNFFPVSLAVNPATNNLIVGNTAAQIRTTDFGGLVECIPDEGYFVTCVGIPATAVITATNQFVLGVEFAADGLAYFSAMNLEQNNPKAILYRLNGDVVETLVTRKCGSGVSDSDQTSKGAVSFNKYGKIETEDNDSDRWMDHDGEVKAVDSDGEEFDGEDRVVDDCLAAQIASHASFEYDSKRNVLLFPTIVDNSKFVVNLNTAKFVEYAAEQPKRGKLAKVASEHTDAENDGSEDSNDHGVDIRERQRDIDSDAPDSDDDKDAEKELKRKDDDKKKADEKEKNTEDKSSEKEDNTDDKSSEKEENTDDKSSEKEDNTDDKSDDMDNVDIKINGKDDMDSDSHSVPLFKTESSSVYVPTRLGASVADLKANAPDDGLNTTFSIGGVTKVVGGRDGTLVVTYQIVHAEPLATGKLSIHTGLSCDSIGPDFFAGDGDSDTATNNPWADVTYTTNKFGQASGLIDIDTGILYQDNIGHAFVVLNSNGDVAACGILQSTENSVAALEATKMGTTTYPFTNTMAATIKLTPVVSSVIGENLIELTYNIKGGIPNIQGNIVIHEFTTCDPSVLVHQTAETVFTDSAHAGAFSQSTFGTDSFGNSQGSVTLNTGNSYGANIGRAVELHDDQKMSVACGVLIPQEEDVPCPICIKSFDFRLDENSINDFDRDGESDSPCIDRDTDDSDCQTVDELREEDSDDFNESDEGRTDDDNHNETRIPDSGWYMVSVFVVVSLLIAVFVKKVFIDAPNEGANTEQHALLKKDEPKEETTQEVSKDQKTVDSVV
eukprot:CAMPEP_0198232164 /NCGR_PEP_ID=MMETSP1445-20131203/115582_1 /TAXON_ID=36898 /ORGANISM="Pyramimonas sp., Strain CCMP2087" /LENGTH=1539 /DNA_ID=CAMNT_0043912815 /DNA_START=253 /DNA_END=4872 /DNA_ORIENTATION=-